jgi:hypothetical protein
MLIYHLSNKQQAQWWQQFRDIVSPHRHDHADQDYEELGGNTVTSVKGPLAASSLSGINKKSAHANLCSC